MGARVASEPTAGSPLSRNCMAPTAIAALSAETLSRMEINVQVVNRWGCGFTPGGVACGGDDATLLCAAEASRSASCALMDASSFVAACASLSVGPMQQVGTSEAGRAEAACPETLSA
eukprot:1396352-Pleurochrysis_carterae.AAC.1